MVTRLLVSLAIFFFKKIYCTENSVQYTRLQNCSLNQFAIDYTLIANLMHWLLFYS